MEVTNLAQSSSKYKLSLLFSQKWQWFKKIMDNGTSSENLSKWIGTNVLLHCRAG